MQILIPWRDSGCPHRLANFQRAVNLYSLIGQVITGDSDPALPFNRAAARNAAAQASDAEVLVFVDADAIVDPLQLFAAWEIARKRTRLVRPFERAGFLTEKATRLYLDGGPLDAEFIHPPAAGFIGLAWVIRRDAYEKLGGFDPAFVGYGGEDNAFSAACDTLYGPALSVPGLAASLWHPADRIAEPQVHERVAAYYAINSWDDYRALRTDLET